MNAVYLAGRGLVSTLGLDVASAVSAVRSGGVAAVRREVAPEIAWPFQAIDDPDPDWWARTQRLVRQAVAESGALATDRRGPLFLASSSVDIGGRERDGNFVPGYHHLASCVAEWLDWHGPVFTVSTACTSSSNAVLSASAGIAAGACTHALVIGLELENHLTVAGFGAMQLLSPRDARPLGLDRDGLVLGEAVAALHLSSTPSRWRVAGGANVVDGSDPAGAVQSSVATMCHQASARSGVPLAAIDLVKLQAAGSIGNDATEAAALHDVFSAMPSLVSLKAMLGHTLGASGAAEIALLTACLEDGAWPSVTGPADPALNVSLAKAPPANARHVLATILGFGGGHAAVVLEDTLPTPVIPAKAGTHRPDKQADGLTTTASSPLPAQGPGLRRDDARVDLPGWTCTAHIRLAPPPADWRDTLAKRLGHRPRRLGPWAELALLGARQCLDAAGEDTLPPDALLRVASWRGADTATAAALDQCRTGQPMPFTFLQSQPSQMLAALSQHLHWQGDARFLIADDTKHLLALARHEVGPAGLLIGWVEEGAVAGTEARSEWWRLIPS
ncbi:MAG: beta-ketoacyl synthase N-terminal-like domain-containing protein [Rhizobacter sp.]